MPRLFISTYGLYNSGNLIGDWFDADSIDTDSVLERITELAQAAGHAADVGDELMVQDTEGFCGINIGECPDYDDVAKLAEAINDNELAVVLAAQSYSDIDDIIKMAADLSYYEGDSEEDACAEYCEQAGTLEEIPAHLRNYFDYAAFANDLQCGGDAHFVRHEGRTYMVMAQ